MGEVTRVLGRRFSLAPVLGLGPVRFAWKSNFRDTEAGKGMSRGVFRVQPDQEAPAEAPPPAPKPAAAPAKGAESLAPAGKGAKEPSNVYTRAQYSRRPLTPEEEAAVDAHIEKHKKTMRTRYVNPLAIALEVDAPASRIAHYIETKHGLPTIPPKPGEVGAVHSPEGADTMRLHGGDFNGWADDYARRLRDHDAGVHFFPEDQDLEAENDAIKAGHAAKLASYAREGVITPKKAAEGASRLSLEDDGVMMNLKLLGWA